jgi:thiol:disulfide interchange protein DsbG
MKRLIKGLLVIAAVVTNFAASAGDEVIELPGMLSKLEQEGGTIHARFKVSEHLNGFAITVGMDQLIVYATADGKHVINGSLLDEDAVDLTVEFADEYIPELDLSYTLPQIEKSAYFETHDKKANRQLYILHDANCGYCKKAWSTIMQYEHHKGTSVRWIPVGALGKNSKEKAAALIHSSDPVKLQNDFDRGYTLSDKDIKESSGSEQKVVNNTQLLKFLRITGTPGMILVEEGKVIKIMRGFRRGEIMDILGV